MSSQPAASILMVDDRPENLLALEAVLEPLDQTLIKASSGEEALKKILEYDSAVILLDVQMPGMDGFEVATYVKRLERTRSIPIIFLTAISTESQNFLRGYEEGAVDYLIKPYDPRALLAKVSVFVDLHVSKAALVKSEDLFRTAFDNAPIGIAMVGFKGDYQAVNRSLCSITGYSEAELLQLRFQQITHPQDLQSDLESARQLVSGEIEAYESEKRYLHADGSTIWVKVNECVVTDREGRPLHFISHVEDITARKQAEDKLTHQAMHDSFTDLPNRVLFIDRLSIALARLQRSESLVGVLFLDLDRFKLINDILGHDCGDELLKKVSSRLVDVLRPTDTVARLGGDEFTIVCEDIADEKDIVTVANRVAETLSKPFVIGQEEMRVTASIGIVLTDNPGAEPSVLLRNADSAMYRAKEQSESTYVLFDEGMNARATERMSIEQALHGALESSEFRLVYQPVVRLDTAEIVGVEALVRWDHPRRGVLEPAKFLPIAEQMGLMPSIGAWVMTEAWRQVALWHAGYPEAKNLTVAINLSPSQLRQPDLIAVVVKALGDAHIDAGAVCFEITEGALMSEMEASAAALRELKALGVTIAIDDFGTGIHPLLTSRVLPSTSSRWIVPSSKSSGTTLRAKPSRMESSLSRGH